MSDRDEVQVARWSAIKGRIGSCLRELRQGEANGGPSVSRSQARLAGELEELGYHVTQSMVSRYEQGVLEAPLTLERIVGWALCCEALSSRAFRELLALAGYYLPWSEPDLLAFDSLLRSYRRLSLADQVVLRGRLLWHILGIDATERSAAAEDASVDVSMG
ncbi:MAG TPA: hypothetical protein VFA49_00170, partial [Chloroflexota bacterium]|nr:hypothetical protein [Chloroflexota bacterium]